MDFSIINSIEPQPISAFFWIPILALIFIIFVSNTKTVNGKSIAVLGPQESGKTQLFYTLQNKPYSNYEATHGSNKMIDFKCIIGEKEFKINNPIDIGGHTDNIRPFYEKLINDNDITLFIFDINKYFANEKYKLDVMARLDFVYRKLTDKYPEKNERDRKYIVIASHIDKLSKDSQKGALQTLQNSIKGKSYESLFLNNLLLCDLTDRTKFLKLLSDTKIFG